MSATPDSPADSSRAFDRILYRLSASRFLTVSLLFHAIIILLAGGTVLYKVVVAPPDFEAGAGGLVVDAATAERPPELLEAPAMEQFTPEAPTLTAPQAAIVSIAQSPTFNVAAVPDAKIRGVSDSVTGMMASLGDKMAGGSMAAGGMGRAGGTRTAMIFGKKVVAAKLGVILDVSGSAHPHLAGAVAEIQKAFDDAILILYPGCGMTDFDGRSDHDIRKYSSVTKRELENNKGNFTTPAQVAKALKIEEFEKMTKRPSVRDTLFVSWFDEEGSNSGKLIGRTQVAFDELVKRDVDSIYWFADFADSIDAEVVKKLTSKMANRKITLHVHNFAGKKINPLVTEMAEKSGGTVNTEKPK